MIELEKRLNEFVNYHITGDGECNGIVLRYWATKHNLSTQEKIELAYLFSVCYCVESAIVLLLSKKAIFLDVDKWILQNKHKLIFQSDRKYIRMKSAFNKCLHFYQNNLNEILRIGNDEIIDLKKWLPVVEKWQYFGRFSAYLYLETISQLLQREVINAEMEWENGATATSGLMNLYCFDEEADSFDKERVLPDTLNKKILQEMIDPVLCDIKAAGGNDNITMVETSLCAYRKFFKGSRYNGYYLDRMLEEIYTMASDFPQISNELIEIRKHCFGYKYLGEIGGWEGVRKECKKLYKERRIMM